MGWHLETSRLFLLACRVRVDGEHGFREIKDDSQRCFLRGANLRWTRKYVFLAPSPSVLAEASISSRVEDLSEEKKQESTPQREDPFRSSLYKEVRGDERTKSTSTISAIHQLSEVKRVPRA